MAANESAVLWSDGARSAGNERTTSESRPALPALVTRWLERRLRDGAVDPSKEALVSVHCDDEVVLIRHELNASSSMIGFASRKQHSLSEWTHSVARTAKEWRLTVREGQRSNELRIAPAQRM
jgi:hypothetical protein